MFESRAFWGNCRVAQCWWSMRVFGEGADKLDTENSEVLGAIIRSLYFVQQVVRAMSQFTT